MLETQLAILDKTRDGVILFNSHFCFLGQKFPPPYPFQIQVLTYHALPLDSCKTCQVEEISLWHDETFEDFLMI